MTQPEGFAFQASASMMRGCTVCLVSRTQTVRLVGMSELFLSQTIAFGAAHTNNGPAHRPQYRQMHGHTFEVEVALKGEANEEVGWIVDIGGLFEQVEQVVALLKDRNLNEVDGLRKPTLECLCQFVAERMGDLAPLLAYVEVRKPAIGQRARLSLTP
jgi:6-pyruvoyltetrahydropterin/6-carboxytetrahydropterin synthase